MDSPEVIYFIYMIFIPFIIFIILIMKFRWDSLQEDTKILLENYKEEDKQYFEKQKRMKVNGIDPSQTVISVVKWDPHGFITYVFSPPAGLEYEILSPKEFKQKYPGITL